MHILQCMGSFFDEISKAPLEISHKMLNPYTSKYAFYTMFKFWRITIS